MYIKRDTGYSLYVYFLDIVCIIFSFFAALYIYIGVKFIELPIYMTLLFVLMATSLIIDTFTENLTGFLSRGHYAEFTCTLKWMCFLMLTVFVYLFITKTTAVYSRVFLSIFSVLNFFCVYFARTVFKKFITRYYRKSDSGTKVTIVTTYERLSQITQEVLRQKNRDFYVSNIIIIDKDYKGETVNGFEITANRSDMFETLRQEIIDEVFICIGEESEHRNEIIDSFCAMGATIHIYVNDMGLKLPNMRMEKFIGYPCLTTSSNEISDAKLMQKRLMDIVGSIIGILITIAISIIVIPAISISSKGSPFYGQVRVGRNGRKFTMYKFRSMYKDADQRKAKLMEQNQMNGLMFKLDNDPRITPIGKFIRKTSIDELPQFYNVLKGDMSMVGTRPPTVDEFERYSLYHKSRLSFKPGITGLWQTSGRSEITNFEDVVKLDKEYIEKWSIALDIKILMKTISTIIWGKGAK